LFKGQPFCFKKRRPFLTQKEKKKGCLFFKGAAFFLKGSLVLKGQPLSLRAAFFLKGQPFFFFKGCLFL
jgi:hypothetical protein